ncbi:uncharacterized protein LOC107832069 [Nicotiana tabacum]|uniref:AT-rich interactive domain-containing protein 2-like n=1 Tax=Nicotiana tabacum TaxID=4097 RepID=A0A1S4DPK6_TOBAC|nr:PREDICTED: uncharacterized protein LOC107832069 [Nicotiana tabacum]XP_016515358.1 PREDICTED: uncharacterized protein LOC107832069 [Nicotiana tabacum]XP_016515359.1 PREDICTED: uncharacterized protein LOC107832069 [Nicotiana tabacum]
MVQKRPFGEEELYEVSSKQPRHVEPSRQLVSFLEFPCESVAPPKCYTSGGEDDKATTDKRPGSGNVAEVHISTEKGTEMSFHGSASNSSWATSSTSEEDIRSEAPFHILTASEYYNIDPPFRVVIHPREVYASLLSNSPRKLVPIGPDFQAELPEWGAYDSKNKSIKECTNESLNLPSQDLESDFVDHCDEESKLAGTCIILMPKLELPADHEENMGAGKIECSCEDAGSFGCVRLHIMETRLKLKEALGEEIFVRLGFYDMGEVVAEKWREEEEELFHEVVFSNPASLGRNFWNQLAVEFPLRSRRELVSYYFNVFILRKRAKQNRFDPLNIDSDNDEWQEIDDDVVAAEAKMTDEDEDSVVESPVYQNYPGSYEIYENDKKAYDEEAGGAALEDYRTIDFGRRNVLSDESEACPDKLIDNNNSSGHNIQPLERHSNEIGDHDIQDNSCTTDAAGLGSEAPQGKTDNSKHWASNFAGVGSGSGHDFVMGPSNGKEWDIGYLSCAKNKVDLLPTCTMIEEVFGDGAWSSKNKDGHGLG